MTLTPTLLLVVALVWTLPASLAAVAYRRNEDGLRTLETSVHHSVERALNQIRAEQTRLQFDA
jgi:hypothetical protein